MLNPICAVIVTYYPNLKHLIRLVTALETQVEKLVIVDNSDNDVVIDWLENHFTNFITLIRPGNNIGLAAAHNMGIHWAKQYGYHWAILFDQDSMPANNMIAELWLGYHALMQQEKRVAAVGPVCIDVRTGNMSYFSRHIGIWLKKHYPHHSQTADYYVADFLITSGSLINIDTFTHIGTLDEALFIDYVDMEWGLRAKNKGYQCYGVNSALMYHCLGDKVKQLANITVHHHSPLRHYYLFRNATLLYRRSYLALGWKLNNMWRLMIRYFAFPLLNKPRWQQFRMINLGIWHGLFGTTGKMKK